jgi:hypothetical protein
VPYTDEILAVYCSDCGAPAGAKCSIFSTILGRQREVREPHPARVSYAKRAGKRRKKK